jgi:hemin uptake protein HemP
VDLRHRDNPEPTRERLRDEADAGPIDSRRIFGTGNEVAIRHGDQIYRLRITRHGKLILNK